MCILPNSTTRGKPLPRVTVLDDLKFVIQYRSRRPLGHGWKNMAAFDVAGPAEKYFDEQRYNDDWPWEYRLVDLHTNSITTRTPQESE